MRRILVTGVGGPAGVSVVRALKKDIVFVADMNPYASGLYLVPSRRRILVPAGKDEAFVGAVLDHCLQHKIDYVIPTVDAELVPLASAEAIFRQNGIHLLIPSLTTLEKVLDKARLMETLAGHDFVPRSAIFRGGFPTGMRLPLIAKPREGSGSRGIRFIQEASELTTVARDGSMMLQEFLPGMEVSVDTLSTRGGRMIAAVPRMRLLVDSGVSVASRTFRCPALEKACRVILRELRLPYTNNVQFKADANGNYKLMEINPRFPGTIPLSIKAGVDFPNLSLDILDGEPVPERLTHDDVAVVRHLEEVYVSPDAFDNVFPARDHLQRFAAA